MPEGGFQRCVLKTLLQGGGLSWPSCEELSRPGVRPWGRNEKVGAVLFGLLTVPLIAERLHQRHAPFQQLVQGGFKGALDVTGRAPVKMKSPGRRDSGPSTDL